MARNKGGLSVKRLTERDAFGNADIIALSDMMPEIYAELSFSETNVLTDALNRLAAYEDTGLEPEEIEKLCDMDRRAKMAEMLRDKGKNGISIDRLREFVEADKDGRCVVLPVEVGQNVYFINQPFDSEICTAIVIGAEINLYTPSCPIWLEIEWFSPTLGKHEYHSRADLMIGKTVFLTREEAEKALQEMSEQDE